MKSEYIFFGTPNFAALILENLIRARFYPSLVVTNPDKPFGRKKIITPSPVKKIALENKIKFYQPEKLILEDFLKYYKGEQFALLAAYGKIVPLSIIKTFSKGIIGVHPSLLPKYRGPTPIQSTILNGEKISGTTLFLLDEEIDNGPILEQRSIELDENNPPTYLELEKILADISANLVFKTIPLYLESKITPSLQDKEKATYTKKFVTQDAFISAEDLKEAINISSSKSLNVLRKIKAFNPEPGVWTVLDNKRIKLLDAEIKDGKLKLTKIQKEGKKPESLN